MEEKDGKLHYVDDLENRLNKNKDTLEKPYVHKIKNVERKDIEIKNTWESEGEEKLTPLSQVKKSKASFGLKFFLFSIVIFILATIYVSYLFITSQNTTSNNNINISTTLAPYVNGGEVNKISITVENTNKVILRNAVLSISYNRGISDVSETSKISEKREIGDLGEGAVSKQDFEVQFYGQEGDVKDFTINIEYHLDGSNGSFNKTVTKTTVIQKSPIEIKIDGKQSVNSGQLVSYNLTMQNNLQSTVDSFLVKVTLPQAFKTDMTKDNIIYFNIDKLDPGETVTKTITGSFEGASGEKSSINIDAGKTSESDSKNIAVVYFSVSYDVEITESPLKLDISALTERGEASILRFGDKLTVLINYENTSNQVLNNVQVVANIKGDAGDLSKLEVLDDGYFDFTDKNITWNKATRNELGIVAPGGKGTFRFTVPIVTSGINTPKISLLVNGTALNTDNFEIVSNISKEYSVQGSASLSGYTSYKNSPFQNRGPVPPVVDTETTYTLHLITSAQNNLDEAKVSFILPIYTTWLGVTSNDNQITYNKDTRLVTWNINHMDSGNVLLADIMISVKPSLSHLGKSPDITGGIAFTGTEIDSKAHISVSIKPLTTNLSNESWGIDTGDVVNQTQGQ